VILACRAGVRADRRAGPSGRARHGRLPRPPRCHARDAFRGG